MATPLRLLMVEDSEDDAQLILRELRRGDYTPDWVRVETAEAMERAVGSREWDIITCDFALPRFSSAAALELVRRRGMDTPFIIVSGVIGEEAAVSAMKSGAHDYIMKSSLRRLVPAVRRELREADVRRDKRQSEAALSETLGRLQALSSRMMQIQETERRTIARELHDEIGQALTAVQINLRSLLVRPGAREEAPRIEASLEVVESALARVRSLSLDLRPPQLDDLGLAAALRWYLERQAKPPGLELSFTASLPDVAISPEVRTACFRIAQEAVTNALRHSRAQRVTVALREQDGELCLDVSDDGDGFDVVAARRAAASGGSLGLIGMEERASLAGGRLECASTAARGTRVRARFALAEFPPGAAAAGGKRA